MTRPKLSAPPTGKPETVRVSLVLTKREYLHAQYLHSLTDCKKSVLEESFRVYYSNMLPKLDLPE